MAKTVTAHAIVAMAMILASFGFIAETGANTPKHPCNKRGFDSLNVSEQEHTNILGEIAHVLEPEGWTCAIDHPLISCTRQRMADELNGVVRNDVWRNKLICVADTPTNMYWVEYAEFDGAISYQNDFPERFGNPRDPKRIASLYFYVN